jgi:hypothetical protein
VTTRATCSRCDCGWCVWARRGLVLWNALVSAGLVAVLAERLLR